MIETTWLEDSGERPSFTEIVHSLESLQSSLREASSTHGEPFAEIEGDINNNYVDLIAS